MSKLLLIHGSCVEQKVDVIVNAANRYLASGGGICGVIFSQAGYEELTDACRKINTPLKDGEAVITPSFGITNCKTIIHAVGPNFNDTKDAFDKLFDAYYNSLVLLKDNNYHSISFPLISSGIFGGNLDNPAKISAGECIKAYNKFVNDYKEYEIEVILCAYTAHEYMEAQKEMFINLLPQETDRVIIRKTNISDVDLLLKMDKQEETQRFLGGIKNKTKEERIALINDMNTSLTICLKDNTPIGFIGLKINNEVELSYIFDYDYINNGYCTEACKRIIDIAFNELNIKCINADTVDGNKSSIRVLEKLGFVYKNNYMKDNKCFLKYEKRLD